MAALFPEWSNAVFRAIVIGGVLLGLVGLAGLMLYVRLPYNTGQHRPVTQPVEFDHRHHARDDGIECLYCHASAERGAAAGLPTAEVCMGCHNQIWTQSPLLAPVRRSYFSGREIVWKRVHSLADFVYFDHSVHVSGGVDCVYCHGEVGNMARVYPTETLQMRWCLDCHRDPVSALAAGPRPAGSMAAAAMRSLEPSVARRQITRLTTCSACHR